MGRRQIVPARIRQMLPKRCVNCGSTEGLEYHHIVPVILGGKDAPSNIAVLCSTCHDKVTYGRDRNITTHSALVREGMARGRKPGRKPADYEKIMRLIAEHSTQFNADSLATEDEIKEMAGVRTTAYYTAKRLLLEAMSAGEWPYDWPKPKRIRHMPRYKHELMKRRAFDGKETQTPL